MHIWLIVHFLVEVLKANEVEMCKIVKFMDQAPSQCKNKTAFNYLANSKFLHRGIILEQGMAKVNVMFVLGGSSKE